MLAPLLYLVVILITLGIGLKAALTSGKRAKRH